MTYFLPPDGTVNRARSDASSTPGPQPTEIADIKIFWGPEICRLEYLLHLLDTGRVKDDRRLTGDPSCSGLGLR